MKLNIITALGRTRWDRVAAVILAPLTVGAFIVEPPLWALITLAGLAWITLWVTIKYERAPRYKRTR